ncbi:hypothetical protein FRC0306_00717 [Corynebacterium diphtheriae]|nr:hypothetical protein FRC0306_00717 [Corynebacterium diphtheriae]
MRELTVFPASRETTSAHSCDLLASSDRFTDSNVERLHMPIHGNGAVLVADTNPLAVAGCWARIDYYTVHHGINRGVHCISDVHTRVQCAPTHTEWRSQGAFCRGMNADFRSTSLEIFFSNHLAVMDCFGKLLVQVRSRRFKLCDGKNLRGIVIGLRGGIRRKVDFYSGIVVRSVSKGSAGSACARNCACSQSDDGNAAFNW